MTLKPYGPAIYTCEECSGRARRIWYGHWGHVTKCIVCKHLTSEDFFPSLANEKEVWE